MANALHSQSLDKQAIEVFESAVAFVETVPHESVRLDAEKLLAAESIGWISTRAPFHDLALRFVADNSRSSEMRNEVLGYLASHFAEIGDYDRASDYIDRISETYLQAIQFAHIAKLQLKSGDTVLAKAQISRALNLVDMERDPWNAVTALTFIAVDVDENESLGQTTPLFQKVRRIADSTQDLGYQRAYLKTLARAQARCGDVGGLIETYADLGQLENSRSKQAVLKAIRDGDTLLAVERLLVAVGDSERDVLHVSLAEAHARIGNNKAAIQLIDNIENDADKNVATSDVIGILASNGSLEAAELLASRGIRPDWKLRNLLALARCNIDNNLHNRAREFLLDANSTVAALDLFRASNVATELTVFHTDLQELAKLWVKCDRSGQNVIQLAEALKTPEFRVALLVGLLRNMGK